MEPTLLGQAARSAKRARAKPIWNRAANSSTLLILSTGWRAERRAGRQGQLADYLTCIDFVIPDKAQQSDFRGPADNSCSTSSAVSVSALR